MSKILIDTNILVYAHDHKAPEKQKQAIYVLEQLHKTRSGYLSAQCLSEFFSATTRGQKQILTREDAAKQVENFIKIWPVFPITPEVIIEALRGVRIYQLAYWDAQIWATARLNRIETILSEDFNAGAALEGVHFVNPFAANFTLGLYV